MNLISGFTPAYSVRYTEFIVLDFTTIENRPNQPEPNSTRNLQTVFLQQIIKFPLHILSFYNFIIAIHYLLNNLKLLEKHRNEKRKDRGMIAAENEVVVVWGKIWVW